MGQGLNESNWDAPTWACGLEMSTGARAGERPGTGAGRSPVHCGNIRHCSCSVGDSTLLSGLAPYYVLPL